VKQNIKYLATLNAASTLLSQGAGLSPDVTSFENWTEEGTPDNIIPFPGGGEEEGIAA